MNIEVNLKKFKTNIKKKRKITLALMLSFLMTGVIGYANDISVYVDTKNEKVLTEEEYNKLNEDEKKKYNKVIIDKNNNVYTIKIDNALHFFSVKTKIKEKKQENGDPTNYENDGAIGEDAVAIGPNAIARNMESVAIGPNAKVEGNGGNDKGGGSVAIGANSLITTNGYDFPSLAIGKNSKVLNGSGLQEWTLSFDSDNWKTSPSKEFKKKIFGIKEIDKINDESRVPGGISIGTNTFARTGSIQIGAHTYEGKMGGIDVNNTTNEEANIVNMTTIGTNSYQKAAMGTMVGAYNISTGKFTNEGGLNSLNYGSQNFGSSVFGTLNSIKSDEEEVKGILSVGNSGVANSIFGIANTTEKSNGSLIFGAGNVIKNSNESLSLTDTLTESFKNVDEAVKKFRKVISKNKAGGATLAIGGANKADYTRQVSMIGTRNEVKGTEDKKTELVSVSGDNNLVENSRNIVAGKNFHVTGEGNVLQGYNNITNDERREVTNNNVVALGNDIKVTEDNAVYLGNESSSNIKEENDNNAKTIWQQQIVKIKQDIYSDKVETEGVKGLEDKIREKEGKKHIGSFFNPLTDEQKEENNKIDEEIKGLNNAIQKLKDENIKKTIEEKYKDYSKYAGFTQMGSILSVGNSNFTRVIQNVAPGLISATSTDAINGSQLYKYVAEQYITIKDGKGGETKVKLGDTLTLKGTTIDVTVKAPEPAQPTPVTPAPATPTETKAPEHTATFEAKGNVGGSDTFGYKYRDDKGKETELKEGPDGKLYTNDFIENNEYKNNKWVKKGTDTDSENISKNQYNKSDEKVILSTKYGKDGKVISNVSDGKNDNDAVNVKQLKEVEDKIKNISNNSIDEAKEKSNLALSGVANAIAIANLVQVNSYSDYRHNLSAAYGYYGKQHALAIGFSGVTENRRVGYKISGSVNTKGNLGLGVGVGVMLGEKSERKLYPEKSNLVKDLKEKVNMQNKQIEELKKENQEIKEMLKKIMEKK